MFVNKRITKIVSSVLGALMCVAALAGCGNAEAAESLKSVTQLPSNGIVTKDQLKTLQGKTGSYSFVGHDDGIKYTWRYDASQIKNPEDQHLKLDVATAGSTVDAVKKAADSAPYALSVKISKFQLAGSPELIVDIPQKWVANKLKVVTQQKGELRQVSSASPTIGVSKKTTELTGTIAVTNKTLYFVCGLNEAEPIPSITEEGDADSAADAATSKDSKSSKDSKTSNSNKQKSEASEKSTAGNGSSSKSGAASQSGTAGDSKSSSGAATPQKDPNSINVTVSVDAKTAAAHMDQVSANKKAYVPSNGWIIAPTNITLKKGQTAYDALAAATKARGIQLESKWFPVYSAYYVEGINNLYEFDGGPASGWMYSVDGWFPNYGSSQYSSLKDGSVIAWRYTLELGNDVGGGF